MRLATVIFAAWGCAAQHAAAPVLRVGTTGDYPPFSVARAGGFDGFDLAVARLYARDRGRRLDVVRFRWPDLIADLRAGRFDLAVGGVTMRPERAVAGVFTRPIVRAGALVLARPDAPAIERPGFRLGVNAGGHLERVALRLFPDAILVRTSDNGRLPRLLADGIADAVLTDEIEAGVIARDLATARRGEPITRDAKAWLGTERALVGDLDRWLRTREADGTLAALRERWLGRPEGRSAAGSDLDALLASIDLRLAFMPAVAAAKRASGRPIEDPAQEARVIEAARTQALAHDLAPDPAAALFRAIIAAAREVQQRFVARPWSIEPMDLEHEARPAIARLSDEIVVRAGDLLVAGGVPSQLDPDAIARALDPSWSSPAARLAIARAIVALRPARSIVRHDQDTQVAPDTGQRHREPTRCNRTGRTIRVIARLSPHSFITDVCKRSLTPLEAARRIGRADKDTKSRANPGASTLSLR